MKRNFLVALLGISLIIPACSGGGGTSSGSNPSSVIPTSSSSDVSSSIPKVESEYDKKCDTEYGEDGHLYFHYLKIEDKNVMEEYNKYCLWMWEKAPTDDNGVLYAATDSKVKERFNATTTSWVEDIFGQGKSIDEAGACIDIDLNASVKRAEKEKQEEKGNTSFEDATKLGFLVVLQTSMDGSDNFTSDGGSDTFLPNFRDNVRPNGSIHVFVTAGDVKNWSFHHLTDKPIDVNPVTDDQTGKYRSGTTKEIVNMSVNDLIGGKVEPTSQLFYDSGAVGYFIFVASFADSNGDGMGDIRGIIDNLDYLEELNVDTLWLSPVQESDSYHGYDTTDYKAVDAKFGTLDDYKELLDKAHKKGMKVMMDLVLNHTSKNNVWFTKSQRAAVEDGINYRDLYQWKFKGDKVNIITKITGEGQSATATYKEITLDYNNWSKTDRYNYYNKNGLAWYKDGESDYYYFGKFGSGMPELNYDNQQTRDMVADVANYWCDIGVDGFRLDAVKHIYMCDEVTYKNSSTKDGHITTKDLGSKTYWSTEQGKQITTYFDYACDTTKNINFWMELNKAVKAKHPNCFFVGENFDGWDQRIAGYERGMESQFDFATYYHNAEWLMNGTIDGAPKSAYDLANELKNRYTYFSQSGDMEVDGNKMYGGKRSQPINGAFTSNHDTPRQINTLIGSTSAGNVNVPVSTGNCFTLKSSTGTSIDYTLSTRQPVEDNVFYANVPSSWTAPKAYAWAGASKNAEWPGQSMTKVSGNLWKITLNKAYENIIFNDGKGNQTKDIPLGGAASIAINRVKVDSAIKILTPGISWIYYGDELGMSSNYDNKADNNKGNTDRWSRQPFKWGESKEDYITSYTFGGLEVQWDDYNTELADLEEQRNDPSSVFNYIKCLTAAKKAMGGLNWSSYSAKSYKDCYAFSVKNTKGTTFNVYINPTSGSVTKPSGTVVGHDNGSTSNIGPYGFIVTK